MSYMAPKLKYRAQILKGVNSTDDENIFGGFSRDYEVLTTLWCAIKEPSNFIEAIRGQQIAGQWTHEFTVRKSSVDTLGTAFSSAFAESCDSIADINSLKSDWFIFIEAGASYKGRRFRIRGTRLDEKNSEFLKLRVEEIEESGTGWPE